MNIGLIAGNGQFPVVFAKKARKRGYRIIVAAYLNEADSEIERYADAVEWLHLGQIKRLLKFFKKNAVTSAVMIGGITKTKMFTDIKPDTKAIALIAGMRSTHDDNILRAFANLLEKEGVCIESSTFLLPEILADQGCWTRRKPNRAEKDDIRLGWKVAKEIGRLDIGQCVVAGGGSILAVEAVDGTDATIRRGGELARGNAVLVKVPKPNQDMRFDVPATGVETIRVMNESKIRVLAVEAGKTVVFDREEVVRMADKCGISIVAFRDNDI